MKREDLLIYCIFTTATALTSPLVEVTKWQDSEKAEAPGGLLWDDEIFVPPPPTPSQVLEDTGKGKGKGKGQGISQISKDQHLADLAASAARQAVRDEHVGDKDQAWVESAAEQAARKAVEKVVRHRIVPGHNFDINADTDYKALSSASTDVEKAREIIKKDIEALEEQTKVVLSVPPGVPPPPSEAHYSWPDAPKSYEETERAKAEKEKQELQKERDRLQKENDILKKYEGKGKGKGKGKGEGFYSQVDDKPPPPPPRVEKEEELEKPWGEEPQQAEKQTFSLEPSKAPPLKATPLNQGKEIIGDSVLLPNKDLMAPDQVKKKKKGKKVKHAKNENANAIGDAFGEATIITQQERSGFFTEEEAQKIKDKKILDIEKRKKAALEKAREQQESKYANAKVFAPGEQPYNRYIDGLSEKAFQSHNRGTAAKPENDNEDWRKGLVKKAVLQPQGNFNDNFHVGASEREPIPTQFA